jgi:hypothetical protein
MNNADNEKVTTLKKLILFIVLSNLLSLVVVYFFERVFGYLQISFLSDYAFYSMLLLIALGSLFSFSGYKVGYSDPSNIAGVSASSLIDNESTDNSVITKLENTSLGNKLYIASLFPFAFCVLSLQG